ncbi:MAG TPA: TetR/AcrR family transcriptional regulator [Rhizomicrobium sp.]|jgi:AcrR family transcriptional regulator
MARTQAADFEERRTAIVESAARLFAERGFLGASIAEIAQACGISKSLIYHYYGSKEDILFDAMHSHVRALLDAAEEISERRMPAAAKLRALTSAFMALYIGAASRQRVMLNELQSLAKGKRAIVVGIQRRLVNIVQAVLLELRPELSAHMPLKRPAAMLYFGMINWTHTWLDPEGRADPASIAELAANLFLEGMEKGKIPE